VNRQRSIEARRRQERSERVTLLAGAVVAFALGAGAVRYAMTPDRTAQIVGVEHLSIFAKPATRLAERLAKDEPSESFAAAATPSPRMGGDPGRPGADEGRAVGAITPFGPVLPRWRVQDVIEGRVLITGPEGVRWAAPGVDLGAAGVVRGVEITREGVTVQTSKGRIRR
jgi:hypothetical protein